MVTTRLSRIKLGDYGRILFDTLIHGQRKERPICLLLVQEFLSHSEISSRREKSF
jgi:hypothetical protein